MNLKDLTVYVAGPVTPDGVPSVRETVDALVDIGADVTVSGAAVPVDSPSTMATALCDIAAVEAADVVVVPPGVDPDGVMECAVAVAVGVPVVPLQRLATPVPSG